MPTVTPFALRDEPALIETIFPVQKVSWEAQKERKAGAGQTLTALGSYWKGRKPLILVRSIVLGCLLPCTEDAEADLLVFEQLMGFDHDSLARRALKQKTLKPKDIAALIKLESPWEQFAFATKNCNLSDDQLSTLSFPLDADEVGLTIRWGKHTSDAQKLSLIREALDTYPDYESRASLCKRPEEVDQGWLYESVWPAVNRHYAHLGIKAHSHQELIEQLGILRFGQRTRVGDTFSGGGSIPFEAARLGCEVYASDLNPIACMLTWGALNIIGATAEKRAELDQVQKKVAIAVDAEIGAMGIEHDIEGNRAKAYLYCLEVRCPETGWMVPVAPSWVISPRQNTIAKLIPDHSNKRFDIEVHNDVSKADLKIAKQGTLQKGSLVYDLDGAKHSTPIKTIRGDYKDAEGINRNRLRHWELGDFKPHPNDIFQERLYAIQWITAESLKESRRVTYFAAVTKHDAGIEQKIESIVAANLADWQEEGLVPDMAIEPGYNTDQPIRERGWTYWHHLFSARELLKLSVLRKHSQEARLLPAFASTLDFCSKLSRWIVRFGAGGGSDFTSNVFSNQALNTLYNWANRSVVDHELIPKYSSPTLVRASDVRMGDASSCAQTCDIFITDPPYADAVHYHEITEFFIAWLRKKPPSPFDQWTWDSRRALAIKGSGDEFRRGMVEAYTVLSRHMPENGRQCVMFTHQDAGVWSDMVGIFWAAGLQVSAAWYIATETTSELKKGGHVQGTVTLILRKRPDGDKPGFRQQLLPAVRREVQMQIGQMMNLNDNVAKLHGEPVFNDSDLQMAGYAAALKVLTGYTQVDGKDVTSFALQMRKKDETTVVDEIVQQAAEAANSVLVPDGLPPATWDKISGVQRFYLRMLDMETTGASKLDNYQNFAKAFRVTDYSAVMASTEANAAALKQPEGFTARELSDSSEIGATWLGQLIIGVQQVLNEIGPQIVVQQLSQELPDFLSIRANLVDILRFLESKAEDQKTRDAAELLADRMKNLKALGQ